MSSGITVFVWVVRFLELVLWIILGSLMRSWWNFQGCITVYLSRYKQGSAESGNALQVYLYKHLIDSRWIVRQHATSKFYLRVGLALRCLSRDSLFNISQPSALVNNFFSFDKTILKIFGKKRVAHYSFIFLYLQNRTLIKSLFQDFFYLG